MQDLETVVDALGLDRFVLYAYSAGGSTGVEYAFRHPERVSRLVLAATFVSAPNDMKRLDELKGLARFIETGWEAQAARSAMAEFLAPEADDVSRRVLMHFLGVSAEGHQIAGFMQGSRKIDVSESARQIRTPTLVIAGHRDVLFPLDAMQSVAAAIPGAQLAEFEGAGHSTYFEEPERFNALVAEFLEKHP